MASIGYVGLGSMGSGMVRRLLAAGNTVTGWNRTRSKAEPLMAEGMLLADTPRAATEASDFIFTMVRDTKALEAVVYGDDGILAGLGPGKIFADMSTISPARSRELAEDVAKTGAVMLDAPVSGSTVTLEMGKLSIMVGGDHDAFERIRPVLLDIGHKAHHVGANGQAVVMKIGLNLGLPIQIMALAEGILLAEKAGIPREVAADIYFNSVLASPALIYRGPFVVNMPEEPLFDVNMMQKDLLLALDAGRELDVSLPTTSLANEILTAARAMGLADQDFAVLFQVLARMAGLEK